MLIDLINFNSDIDDTAQATKNSMWRVQENEMYGGGGYDFQKFVA